VSGVDRRLPKSTGITETTDQAWMVEIAASAEVSDFVAEHGGRVYVWISRHQGFRCSTSYLETALENPHGGMYFRRRPAPGFHVYLECTQRIWPKTMEFALRHRQVEAYWNGLAWIV
jgi:hypothetical protein